MKSQEITRTWYDYFMAKDHTKVPSASLVSPEPSLLFTIAGMVPFIPYFTGVQTPPYDRAVSVQKCIRTEDIEEVGKTARHGTFFQMCGNFSFGDYFKEQAIPMAWELLTTAADGDPQTGLRGFGLDPQRLWVTVYEHDDEAYAIWRDDVGVPAERIQRFGPEDNYWTTGQPGPGGPCSRTPSTTEDPSTAPPAALPQTKIAMWRSGTWSSCSTGSPRCAPRPTLRRQAPWRTRASTPVWDWSGWR